MYVTPRATVSLLSTVVSLLLVDRGGCYPGEMMGRLPQKYQDQLELLELALGLNVEWSAVWSEKLLVDPTDVPDPRYCVRLIELDADAAAAAAEEADDETTHVQTVDPFDIVKQIVGNCSHSGLYVQYGVGLLSQSVRCFFYRNARIHVSLVQAHLSDITPEFVELLRRLVDDYRLIADKMAAVDTSLKHVVQLATFFHDVADMSARFTKRTREAERLLGDLEKRVSDVFDGLNSIFSTFCETEHDDWFDDDKNEIISLKPIKNKNKTKSKKDKEKKKDKDGKKKKKDKGKEVEEDDEEEEKTKKDKKGGKEKEKKKDTDKEEDDEKDKKEGKEKEKKKDKNKGEDDEKDKKKDKKDPISRVNDLRLIMRRVFTRLFITEMPDKFWEDIFTETILIKASAFQATNPEGKPKKKLFGSMKFGF